MGAQSTQKRTLQKFNKNQLLSVSNHGGVAHLGERLNGIQEVRGSIPLISTKKREGSNGYLLFFYFEGDRKPEEKTFR